MSSAALPLGPPPGDKRANAVIRNPLTGERGPHRWDLEGRSQRFTLRSIDRSYTLEFEFTWRMGDENWNGRFTDWDAWFMLEGVAKQMGMPAGWKVKHFIVEPFKAENPHSFILYNHNILQRILDEQIRDVKAIFVHSASAEFMRSNLFL